MRIAFDCASSSYPSPFTVTKEIRARKVSLGRKRGRTQRSVALYE